MSTMMEIIRKLSPLRLGVNCDGADQCARLLCEELPFTVHEWAARGQWNGWIVPMKWEVDNATIHDEAGNLLYDGMAHPLGVIGYSQPHMGVVSRDELRKHLFFTENYDDALVYHCDLWYKPHRKEWGFSVPKKLFDALPEGNYLVDLRTRFEAGTMKVLEYILPADEARSSIILNAHNCHPFLANDDLSGVAVGIEVVRRLRHRVSGRRHNIRLVIGPEHYGSLFYLRDLHPKVVETVRGAIFLEALGTPGPLALQRSFLGDTPIDRALINVLTHNNMAWSQGEFRSIVGNDETIWEAIGYEIPCPSISRVPFPEYHTSKDSPDIIDEEQLEKAVQVVVDAIDILDHNKLIVAEHKGLFCLSNPEYDLYQPIQDPSEPGRRAVGEVAKRWNHLMNCLPRYFDDDTHILEIAERHGFSFRQVYDYLKQFETAELISLHHSKKPLKVRRLAPL